ncbi:sensor histidine kinase [Kitasatospora sp. NPDC101801]|uniref:sensor histidine kinase n=1 Tax=Kitasatospora sp. NPDC101801 TaxID=3364103 RepID=UPI0037F353BA
MSETPQLPLLKRITPGSWTLLAWCAGTVLTFLVRLRLPGEGTAAVPPGVLIQRWDGLTTIGLAGLLTLAGARLLRRRPLAATTLLLTAAVVGTTPLGAGEIPLPQYLAVDLALYFVAAGRPRRTSLTAAGLALGVLAGYVSFRLAAGWAVGTSTELTVALTVPIAWLLGNSVHQSRTYADRVRAQTEAQAITTERLRIARELHDMVAHSIGIIALQAGAAKRVIDSQPTAARDALGTIETTGRETLAGLRRMLGALRQGEPAGPAPLDPGPGLADLDRLAATTTAAGVRVELRQLGEPHPLPPELDAAAYRIIQEAVTNVVKHAGTDSCTVTVEHRERELAVEVTDRGRGPGRRPDSGYGLLGMRERTALLHGDFTAGAHPDGGFRVTARLPIPALTGAR